jgi:inorganic triphosphatase YgiF
MALARTAGSRAGTTREPVASGDRRPGVTAGAPPRPIEIEAALAIASSTPARVAGEIAGLDVIGGARLVPAASQHIRDLHVDTADRALASRRFSLRVRTIGTEQWVTLKGASRRTPWGAVERSELERPWSPEALEEVMAAVHAAGIAIGASAAASRPADTPLEDADPPARAALRGLGLRPVQIRSTERRRRHVPRPDGSGPESLVEVAIDAVTYHLERRDVSLYEVEVEALAEGGAGVAGTITGALLERFAPALRPWPHGKLATGLAVDGLLAAGVLEPLLLPDGSLGAAALDKIDAWLGGERR